MGLFLGGGETGRDGRRRAKRPSGFSVFAGGAGIVRCFVVCRGYGLAVGEFLGNVIWKAGGFLIVILRTE